MPQRGPLPFAACAALLGWFAAPCPAQGEATILRGGRVHVRPGTVLEGVDVLIEKDVIKAVGKDVKAPEGARVVDLAGEDLYPGLIDPMNDGLLEPAHTGRGAFGPGDPTLDGFDAFLAPNNVSLLSSGVLTVGLGTAPAGIRGGVTSVLAVGAGPGEPAIIAKNQIVPCEISALERAARGAPAAAADRFGLAQVAAFPTSTVNMREAAAKAVEELLEGAKRYREAWEKYQKDVAEYEKKLAEWEKNKGTDSKPSSRPSAEPERRTEGSGGGRRELPPDFRNWPREKRAEWMRENMGGGGRRAESSAETESASGPAGSGKPKPPEKPRTEVGKEALVRVLKREVPLWVTAHWATDIDAALEIAKSRNVRVVIAGASEAHRRIDALKEARVVVALGGPLFVDADSLDRLMQREDLCAILAKAGIPVTFYTAGDPQMGPAGLPLCAALGMGCGMTEDQALAAVTLHAARALGLEKKMGSIEAQKLASFFTCRGSPFAPGAKASRVWVQGKPVELEPN